MDLFGLSFTILTELQALSFLFGGFVLFSLFLFITAKVNFWIRFIGIPIILVLTIWGFAQLDSVLGYPYPGLPPQEVTVLGMNIEKDSNAKVFIILWVVEDGKARLYKFPWSKQAEEELKKGLGSAKSKGGKLRLKTKEKGQTKSDQLPFILHELYHFKYPSKPGAEQ